ncbi:hypothetical protein A9P82_08940 [Arachidicoccus ginsenosidimutans]|uniref:hypothetical protein n=1 Tax=Arachidicoccus sp. BS20 TaxID=1850526 RepID=UPI0007F0D71F|nr:hypothetical protein [Arachidicoccus sp. BS20]ANI89409.1 hypothetical protein A9P82_08940 [Arachidicoccus sp. BS20]
MKKSFINLIGAAVFVLSASFAKAATEFNVSLANSETVKIEVNNSEKNVSISVTDESGSVLYQYDNVAAGAKGFNFSTVPDGRYFIKMENDRTIETTLVTKVNHALKISKNYDFVAKPLFQKKGKNKLNLYFVNLNNSNVEVDVYDKDRTLINSFTSNDAVIEKSLDFSKVLQGNYEIVLSTDKGDNIFSKSFVNE